LKSHPEHLACLAALEDSDQQVDIKQSGHDVRLSIS
jgi:hypothetical protein